MSRDSFARERLRAGDTGAFDDVLSMGSGQDATAVAYVESRDPDGRVRWGIGTDPNILTASLHAVVSTVLRQRG